MKKILMILLLFMCLLIHANSDFDPSKNYQGKNASSYVGEILIIREFPQDFPADKCYRGFKDFSFNAKYDSENYTYTNYHFGPGPEDTRLSGTNAKWLTGKSFRVNKVYNVSGYEFTYVFELTNINDPSDKLKYIYHADKKFYESFYDFPFFVQKHINYLKKTLIGNKVVVGTKQQDFTVYEHNYLYMALCNKDINGNLVNYNKEYHEFTVTDVYINKQYQEIAIKLSDGSIKTEELYSLHYEKDPIKYNSTTRVYAKNEWDSLVSVHGLKNMYAVMSGKIIPGMPLELAIMSRGRFVSLSDKGDYYVCKWSFQSGKQPGFNVDKKTNKIISASSEMTTSDKIMKKIDNLIRKIF